jgi:hypothetical protein
MEICRNIKDWKQNKCSYQVIFGLLNEALNGWDYLASNGLAISK